MSSFMNLLNFSVRDARVAGERHDNATKYRMMKLQQLSEIAPKNTIEQVLHALMFHVIDKCDRVTRIKFSDVTYITREECKVVTDILRNYGFHAYVSLAWGVDGFVASVSWATKDVPAHFSPDRDKQLLAVIPSVVETSVKQRIVDINTSISAQFDRAEIENMVELNFDISNDNETNYADLDKTLSIVTELLDELSPSDRVTAIKQLVQSL